MKTEVRLQQIQKNDNLFYFPLLVSIILTYIFFFVITCTNFRKFSNIAIYVIGSLFFFCCYLFGIIFDTKGFSSLLIIFQESFNKNKTFLSPLMTLLSLIYLYIGINFSEVSLLSIRSILLFTVTVIFTMFALTITVKKAPALRLLVSLCLIIYTFFCLYMPNFFEDYSGGVHHVDAYTTSIINVCNGHPYITENSSIYGHHGLVMLPLVKCFDLFFSQWTAITLSIAILGSISVGLMVYILDKLTNNDFLFSLASLGLCYYSCYSRINGNYYQMEPHRYLFQAITLFGCFLYLNHQKDFLIKICMWGVVSISVLWNLETGLVTVVVWAMCCICKENFVKWNAYSIIKNVALSLCSFIIPYGLVCLYNVCVGGKPIDFLTFIYPIGESIRGTSNYFNIESLGFGIRLPIDIWFVLYAILISFFTTKFVKVILHKSTWEDILGICGALIGLGTLGYFMNEPWNECKYIAIYGLIVVCLLVIKENPGKRIAIFLICFFACSSFLAIPERLKLLEAHTHNEASLDQFIDGVSARIPINTAFVGKGSPQLCSLLDRKNPVGYMDEPDMVGFSKDYVKSDIDTMKYPYILMDKNSRLIELVQDYNEEVVFDYYDSEGVIQYSYVLYRIRE